MAALSKPTDANYNSVCSMITCQGIVGGFDAAPMLRAVQREKLRAERGTVRKLSAEQKARIDQQIEKLTKEYLAAGKRVGGIVAAYKANRALVEKWITWLPGR